MEVSGVVGSVSAPGGRFLGGWVGGSGRGKRGHGVHPCPEALLLGVH